jgi:hypothetical protein
MLGIVRAGAVQVNVNPLYTPRSWSISSTTPGWRRS